LHLEVTEKYLASGKVKICFDGSANPALGAEINYETAIAMNDASDTWGHGVTKFNDVAGEFKIEKVRILERGPVRARACITSRYNNSLLTEDILLYAESDEIEIRSHLNWQEKRKLLKLRFAHNAVSPKFTTEIPYSFSDRNTDGTEYPYGAWMFVTDSRQGIGVITNSKSAASCDDKYLYVTVCRSPLYAHHVPPHSADADEGARYIDQGEQEFSYKIVLGAPSWQKAEMPKRSAAYLQKPVAKIESSHGGRLPGKLAYLKLAGSPSILCEVVKQAESGKGIVLRFRETLGASGSLNLEIQGFKNILTLDLKPYDIKQIKVLDNVLMEVDLFE
jgi:alpha-mannosidase